MVDWHVCGSKYQSDSSLVHRWRCVSGGQRGTCLRTGRRLQCCRRSPWYALLGTCQACAELSLNSPVRGKRNQWPRNFVIFKQTCWVGGTTGSASDQQSTNDRKVAGSRPTKVVCITVLTGNRMGWTVRCGRPPLLLPSGRKLEFRLSALMDSDLAWVNGQSGRQSWRYAGCWRFPALYHIGSHLPFYLQT